MNISPETLTGIIVSILGYLLAKAFDAVASYFKSKVSTLDQMQKTLQEMQFTIKGYDEKIDEIPRLKRAISILFDKNNLTDKTFDSK